MNCELPDVQAGFRKGRGTRDQITNIHWIIEKARVPEKHLSALQTMPKPLTVWITTDCGKFFKSWEHHTTLPVSWEICMQAKNQQLELNMEEQTASKWGKEYVKAAYCHPAYLTSVQRTSCEMLGWMNHKLESRLLGEISITSDMQMTPPLWQKVRTKEPLDESEKVGLKLNIQKTMIMASSPITSWQMGKQWTQTLFSWAPKSLQMVITAMKLKVACSLEKKLWPT